jgi:hypothetical protein
MVFPGSRFAMVFGKFIKLVGFVGEITITAFGILVFF